MNDCFFQHFSKVYGKIWGCFCLNTRKRLFDFQSNRNSIGFLKSGSRDFQNNPPFERWSCFYVKITENFERFQYFNFEINFLKNKTLFKKLEYRFLVESTKIESAAFTYKTALSEANGKTNRMESTKWTFHNKRSFVP